MTAPKNRLKRALASGQVQRGLWLSLGSETVTEIAGRAGFDWCLIDGEHGPFDPTLIRRQLMVLQGTPTSAVVRVPVAEDWVLKQVLDLGAQSVLVPMVGSAADAERVVRACRYPPDGVRGMGGGMMRAGSYGAWSAYPATANDEICVLVQAESRAAMADLQAIAATDGVDGVFFGPADLGADMGYRDALDAPEVWAEIARGIGVVCAAGAAAGIIVPPEQAGEMIKAGIGLIAVGSDAGLMTNGLTALARGEA